MDRNEFAEKKAALFKEHGTKRLWMMCRQSAAFFIFWFVEILSSEEERWVPFILWPYQVEFLQVLNSERRIILLKARQLGFTTIVIAYLLWRMIFYPVATVGLFSRGELEAMELLDRLVKAYNRLPDWITPDKVVVNNAHLFELSNGSWARAMSTNKGESFTFRYLFLDELDRFDNADVLIRNVKPAADAGNAQIIAGSIADKDRPLTVFKNMFRAAWKKASNWYGVFLPWQARPDRSQAWYDEIVADALERHSGDMAAAMDEVNQQYPGSPEDALSPRKQGKRIPYMFLQKVYVEQDPIRDHGGPAIQDLKIYKLPEPGRSYVLGADPAEGVEGGSDSSLRVLDKGTGEEVAALEGKFEPKKVFPKMIFDIAMFYNMAAVLVERNNHGHAVLAELAELITKDYSNRSEEAHQKAEKLVQMGETIKQETGYASVTLDALTEVLIEVGSIEILLDPADKKVGWLTSPTGTGMTRGKVAMYDNGAQQVRDGQCILHDPRTLDQLASIDINSLRNPSGKDDCADAWVLAASARVIPSRHIKGQVFF